MIKGKFYCPKREEMAYKYENPLDKGFERVKFTKKQHNELFPRRKIGFGQRYEYYLSDKWLELYCFAGISIVILNTLLFPILVLLHGLTNIKEVFKEVISLYNQKETGTFTSDSIPSSSNLYKRALKVLEGDD